ncbi:MAG: alpha/beta fold hydrolase [Leptospiraceae bacterium]|nr:alpha/beta fold hydrolase [Leptospiraceae bacterium]MDW8306317.1 alpha/beta fold hydrolase [Leptospiraceae bacterium]
MLRKFVKGFLALIGAFFVFYFGYALFRPLPSYESGEITVEKDFGSFLQKVYQRNQGLTIRHGNEELLVRNRPGKAKYAILYVHGFGASRAEGEYAVNRLAKEFQANVYYLRLPGHGTNIEDHLQHGFQEYLRTAEEALWHMPLLGEKIVVIGTSMGGLISTWLAATHKELVHALVLVSPFYDYADPRAIILKLPGGVKIGELIMGKYRIKKKAVKDPKRREGYENYWYVPQYMAAVEHLENLRRFAAREEIYRKISCPVLMLVYYKDPQNKDGSARVDAMRHAFGFFSTPENKKWLVEIPDGDHVLLSEYVASDKEKIHKALVEFMKKI